MEITKYVLGLLLLILKEYMAYKKKLGQGTIQIEEFKKIVDLAVIRLRESYRVENGQVGGVEDQMDAERRRSEKPVTGENTDV